MEVHVNKASMIRRVFLGLFFFVVLFAGLGSAALAQTTASIKGTVTDASGAAVFRPKVTGKGTSLRIQRPAHTKANGDYEFPALPPGSHTVHHHLPPFHPPTAPSSI